jgi:hypothetical protein
MHEFFITSIQEANAQLQIYFFVDIFEAASLAFAVGFVYFLKAALDE